jgi:hypothetical protein
MSAGRPRLDIDTTRERLLALGCVHAADHLGPLLTEAVREGSGRCPGRRPMPSSTGCWRRSCRGARSGG